MRGSSFGKLITMTTFGESHGKALGVVIDGMPAQLQVNLADLKEMLKRRAPGNLKGTTSRKEPDDVEILSGVYEGQTLGTPIAVIVRNTGQRSKDYDDLKNDYRPGHADRTTIMKYGIRDHRGGGRASGRETVSRVIGGYFAGLITPQVQVQASIVKLGEFQGTPPEIGTLLGPYHFCDPSKEEKIESFLLALKSSGDSIGGKICIRIKGIPQGLGEPPFDKLKADFSKALMSIGAVTSFSYGAGEEFCQMSGKEAASSSSHFGGIEGGISNGEEIILHVTFKPTSTVGEKAQKGRHDPCIMPRACVVLESMIKFIIADHYLRQKAYENSSNKNIY